MAKLSIEVTGKIRSGLFVLSALWEQGPMVARLVTEKLRKSLQRGDEPPQFLVQIRGLGQFLKSALQSRSAYASSCLIARFGATMR